MPPAVPNPIKRASVFLEAVVVVLVVLSSLAAICATSVPKSSTAVQLSVSRSCTHHGLFSLERRIEDIRSST